MDCGATTDSGLQNPTRFCIDPKSAKSAREHVEKSTRQLTASINQRFFNDSFFRESARGKLAELLIGGKVLRFSGGSYLQQRADL